MNRTRISAVTAAAVTVALLAAGCSSTGVIHNGSGPLKPLGTSAAPATTPAQTPSDVASTEFGPTSAGPTTPSSFGPPPAASVALVAKFSAYPSGSHPWVKNKTGPFAIDEFVEAFYAQDEWPHDKDLAKQRQMQGAARHGWFNSDQSQTEVWLVKFAAATGATAMYHGLTDNPDLSGGQAELDAAGVHGKMLVDPTPDKLGNASVSVVFTVGDTLVYLTHFSPIIDKTKAQALALTQYTTLKTGH